MQHAARSAASARSADRRVVTPARSCRSAQWHTLPNVSPDPLLKGQHDFTFSHIFYAVTPRDFANSVLRFRVSRPWGFTGLRLALGQWNLSDEWKGDFAGADGPEWWWPASGGRVAVRIRGGPPPVPGTQLGTSPETRGYQSRNAWVPVPVPDTSRCIFSHCNTLGFSERRLRRASPGVLPRTPGDPSGPAAAPSPQTGTHPWAAPPS